MKKLQTLLLSACLLVLCGAIPAAASSAGQDGAVTVIVSDAGGPLPGAGVLVKGTTTGEVTDLDGQAVLRNVDADATLVISFIGYLTQEIPVQGRSRIEVLLREDSQMLEETVVVGYGVQKKESLTGSISQIRSEDITNTKSADALATLQGKVPGLLITQNSGKPGAFASQLSLRGYGTPMIVVDGVVRSGTKTRKQTSWNNNPAALESYTDLSVLQEINPEDIESISVLKDASATIYGLGAENGVILITTKKGTVKKPSVSISTSVNLSRPVVPRDVESWVDFMKWENGMSDLARMGHRFSEEDIHAYETGDPNYTYTDWYDTIYKKFAVNRQHNVSISGGTETVSYYLGGGYADDQPILKSDNYGYHRYNFNANVSIKLTKDLTARYTSSFKQSNKVGLGSYDMDWNIFYYMYQSNPMVGVHPKDNPLHYSDVEEHMNPAALLDADTAGYTKTDSRTFNNTVDLTYAAPFLKGLTISATGAYDFDWSQIRTLIRQYKLYDYATDAWVPGAQTREENQYSELHTNNSRVYGRVQALYDRSFGPHNVSAMLGAEITDIKNNYINGLRKYGATADDSFYTHDILNAGLATTATNAGTRNEIRSAGYIGRLNYNYKGKYLVELMGRYDGNYQFARGHRWGFFPSYSLGWRMSEEPFFKKAMPWFNNLKFRWSDGRTGSVQGDPYAYIGGYTADGNWIFNTGRSTTGYSNMAVESSILTWADVRMMDFGVDWELWNGKLGGTFDWFKREMIGTAAVRNASLPDYYGVRDLPKENLNRSENLGLELSLSHRNTIGEFSYRVMATATVTRSRNTYIESENTRKYASAMDYWMNSTLNRWTGYHAGSMYHWTGDRFHNLDEASASRILYDLNGSGRGNGGLVPGMYEIEDRNGNGYIDSGDLYYTWGNAQGNQALNPPLQYGLNIGGNWRNLDFSMVFNGASMRRKLVSLSGYAGFGKLNYLPSQYTDSYHVANYGADPWDPETTWVEGWWPALVRVERSGDSHNGPYTSNQPYNYINSTYLRLKTVELGYTFSPELLRKAGMRSVRVFFNGGNLLTFSNKLLKYVDPESFDNLRQGGEFQISKTYIFGFNINF